MRTRIVPRIMADEHPPTGRSGWYEVVGLGLNRWWDGVKWTAYSEPAARPTR